MKFGQYEILALSDGRFALDGGAMFGVVPRVFWQKMSPPDERNRITLALRPLLIKTPQAVVLVDTGIGTKQDEKFRQIYRIEQPPHLLDSLLDAGFRPEDVTHVVNSHLHFDHAGNNTVRNAAGAIVPAFPNAKYIVQEKEWQMAMKPDVRSKASYLPENFIPVREAHQLVTVNGDSEFTPGVSVIHTGGHTAGHQSVVVESQSRRLVYWGDLVPTASHINVPYVMGYDTTPLVTIEQKEKLFRRVVDEHWLMCFEHDPEVAFSYLKSENDRFVLDGPSRE